MEKYTCQRPIHPGELLKEEIECRHLPQTQLDYNMQQATRDKSFMERLAQVRKYAALL